MARSAVCTSPPHHRVTPRLGDGTMYVAMYTPSLGPMLAWFFISLLCTAAGLVFNQPKRAHITPLLIQLHWLPVAARIKFKSLMLAYRVIAGLALPSVQERQSRLFSFIVPRWWNELPSTTRAGASHSTFKKLWKTQLFKEHLPS